MTDNNERILDGAELLRLAEEKIRRYESRLSSLENILQFRAQSVQELLDTALDEVIKITESKIGYIYFYHEGSKQFVLNSRSKDFMQQCAVADPQRCYELAKTGVWGEVVRQRKPLILNDFQADHPFKKGYPAGHVSLTRFLTVPVFKDDQIVAVVGVGNKASNYDEVDVLQLTMLMKAVWNFVDIKRGEEALRTSEQQHRAILQTAMDGFWRIDTQGHILEVNESYCRMSGFSKQELLTMSIPDLEAVEMASDTADRIQRIIAAGGERFESRHRRKDGSSFDVEVSAQYKSAVGEQFVVFLRDITERKRAEEEKGKLEAQLRQSQKMESVGRLAGGVAHDFNNMLGVILGHTEMAMAQVDNSLPLHNNLAEISKAANRSVAMTRQLLAFARKQTIAPKILNLNETVGGMITMLKRLIGENIDLNLQPAVDLWPVRIDPSQFDQILVNLCVNARDAISGIGKLVIETGNSIFETSFSSGNAGLLPGEYAYLAVRDSGCGMNKETLSHLFEPFFTTKEMGKGTGLGLATVYGAVKQNNGYIYAKSELGHGATFTIYLPRYLGKFEVVPKEEVTGSVLRGNETILLVEDEPGMRETTAMMLEMQGYRVLTAATPSEAICLARENSAQIKLLITDVIMPEMNGRDLAKNLLSLYPHLKYLFLSGYAADVLPNLEGSDKDGHFVQKPFSMEDLATKIRKILDNAN
ncbi:MAG: GAF domain-containing protein [Candidatus Ozemobacteraceae bacterium]